jgi:hypothetical protein
VKRTGELATWRLFAERSVAPSAFGFLVTRDEAGLSFERRLAPRWNTSLGFRRVSSDDIAAAFSGEVHLYERADTALSWQASRTVRLIGSASVTRIERAADSPYAEGWRAIVAVTWTPQPRIVSR